MYLNFDTELKKTMEQKVTVIPVVIGALGTVIEGVVKGLEDIRDHSWSDGRGI